MFTFASRRLRPQKNIRAISSLPPSEPFNILFLGRDEFSCVVLQQLHAARDVWQNITIATQPDHRTGRRGHNISVSPLKLLGESLNLDVQVIPAVKSEFKDWTLPSPFCSTVETRPPSHHLLITASFGRILPYSHLKLFAPSRRLNIHPSLLPAYRGSAPIQHALIQGEKSTGVCVTRMLPRKAGIDCGDIWAEKHIDVPHDATFSRLRDLSARVGGELLVSTLRNMLSRQLESAPQKTDEDAPKAPLISFEDTLVDPTAISASQIARTHRAIERPVIVRFRRDHEPEDEKLVQLHTTSVIAAETLRVKPGLGLAVYDSQLDSVVIGCRDDSYLQVTALKQENRNLLQAKQWWNAGYLTPYYKPVIIMNAVNMEDMFNDTIDLFGFGGETDVEDDGFIVYGKLRLSVAPKEGKAISMLASSLFSPSLLLAEKIETGSIPIKGRTVVELGAGCALPSLLAATMPNPPSAVVVTDYPDDLILGNLKQNVDRARVQATEGCAIHCIGYEWGTSVKPLRALLPPNSPGYDIVVLSDLLHFDASHEVLIGSLTALLAKSEGARAYVAAGRYTPPAVCDTFIHLARTVGILLVEELCTEEWMGKMEVEGWALDREGLSFRKKNCRFWTGTWV